MKLSINKLIVLAVATFSLVEGKTVRDACKRVSARFCAPRYRHNLLLPNRIAIPLVPTDTH